MAKERATETDPLKNLGAPPPERESDPKYEAASLERNSASCPSAPENSATNYFPSEMGHSNSSKMEWAASPEPSPAPATEPNHRQPSKDSVTDMDCPICFNRYSTCHRPKLLACQHSFCAICMKLILRNEDHTWVITCPLCRKVTVVFGGLICSLHDKDDLFERLGNPDPETGAPGAVDCLATNPASGQTISGSLELSDGGSNRIAAKRLLLLLLLVAMLVALVLPFIYAGILKWALCFTVALGLAMSAVLCCDPVWRCSDFSLLSWGRKENHSTNTV